MSATGPRDDAEDDYIAALKRQWEERERKPGKQKQAKEESDEELRDRLKQMVRSDYEDWFKGVDRGVGPGQTVSSGRAAQGPQGPSGMPNYGGVTGPIPVYAVPSGAVLKNRYPMTATMIPISLGTGMISGGWHRTVVRPWRESVEALVAQHGLGPGNIVEHRAPEGRISGHYVVRVQAASLEKRVVFEKELAQLIPVTVHVEVAYSNGVARYSPEDADAIARDFEAAYNEAVGK